MLKYTRLVEADVSAYDFMDAGKYDDNMGMMATPTRVDNFDAEDRFYLTKPEGAEVAVKDLDPLKLQRIIQDCFFDLYGTNLPQMREKEILDELPGKVSNKLSLFDEIIIEIFRKKQVYDWVRETLEEGEESATEIVDTINDVVDGGNSDSVDTDALEDMEDGKPSPTNKPKPSPPGKGGGPLPGKPTASSKPNPTPPPRRPAKPPAYRPNHSNNIPVAQPRRAQANHRRVDQGGSYGGGYGQVQRPGRYSNETIQNARRLVAQADYMKENDYDRHYAMGGSERSMGSAREMFGNNGDVHAMINNHDSIANNEIIRQCGFNVGFDPNQTGSGDRHSAYSLAQGMDTKSWYSQISKGGTPTDSYALPTINCDKM